MILWAFLRTQDHRLSYQIFDHRLQLAIIKEIADGNARLTCSMGRAVPTGG